MSVVASLSHSDQLLALTRKMLVSAEQGDWEKLAELEHSRLPVFRRVFAEGVADNIELAQEVLAIDEKTKQLAEAGLPVLQQEILNLKNSEKANNVYQAVQEFSASDD